MKAKQGIGKILFDSSWTAGVDCASEDDELSDDELSDNLIKSGTHFGVEVGF